MYFEFDDIKTHIEFCINTILKEAKEEGRLVQQILYTMLSAYTNNPINLAINSPSGEGKTYVLQKVGDLFPKHDTMFLAGMTEKALFHRSGVLVVKNEVGDYVSIEDKLKQIDSDIEDKEYESTATKDRNLKQGLQVFLALADMLRKSSNNQKKNNQNNLKGIELPVLCASSQELSDTSILGLILLQHRDEPPIGEYIRPNTGKKYFRYRRCTGGKMIESLQDLVEHGVGQRGRPKVRKQQVQQKVDK